MSSPSIEVYEVPDEVSYPMGRASASEVLSFSSLLPSLIHLSSLVGAYEEMDCHPRLATVPRPAGDTAPDA